jgi:RND family efflux transporter MFP subunit
MGRQLWLGLSVLLLGCARPAIEAPKGGAEIAPAKVNLRRGVELVRVEQRALTYAVETVGILEAEAVTDIAAGVNGLVDEVNFREGDEVRPDTSRPLIKVDQKRYLAAVAAAQAALERAQASQRLAQDTSARAQQGGTAVSAQEREQARLALDVAAAEVQSARANFDLAQHHLNRSRVLAPYPGRINTRKVTPGTYLEDKTVIATIADLRRLRLVGYVPESAAPTVRQLLHRRPALVARQRDRLLLTSAFSTPWAFASALLIDAQQLPSGFDPEFTVLPFPGQKFRAMLFYMSTVADPSTHMFECKAEVDVDGFNSELRPGFTARIRFPLQSTADAAVVPEEAVRSTERGMVVFVPTPRAGKEGKIEWIAKARVLDVGYRTPGWVEVRNGVAPGQWIVRRGAEALEEGTPIRFAGDDQATLP